MEFQYLAPTKVIFGRGTEARTGALCKEAGATKVLIHYGGHSAKKSGLIDRICASLQAEGISYTELGGVVPNPRLIKVYEGIELGRKEKIDFILAVGGGSVIDSAKAIGYGLTNEGDVWDYYTGKAPQACMPIGAVLTIAAAGNHQRKRLVKTRRLFSLRLLQICRYEPGAYLYPALLPNSKRLHGYYCAQPGTLFYQTGC